MLLKLIPFNVCFRQKKNKGFVNASYRHRCKHFIFIIIDKTIAKHRNFLGCCWKHGLGTFYLPASTSLQLWWTLTSQAFLNGTPEYAYKFVQSQQKESRVSGGMLAWRTTEHIPVCTTIRKTSWAGNLRRMPPTVQTFDRDSYMSLERSRKF
jgi:hypothetical protein